MIFYKEQTLYISGKCERCDSLLKAYWHQLSETNDGYRLKAALPCSCGRLHGQIQGKENLASAKPARNAPAKRTSRSSRNARNSRPSRKRRAQHGPRELHASSAVYAAREGALTSAMPSPEAAKPRARSKTLFIVAALFLFAVGWRIVDWQLSARSAASQPSAAAAQEAESPKTEPSLLQELDTQLDIYQASAAAWEQTFEQLSSGEISRALAHSRLKQLRSRLAQNSLEFSRYVPPRQLSKEQQDKLYDAARKMASAAERRSEAASAAIDWIDAPSAANEQQFRSAIADSTSFSLAATPLITQVRAELPPKSAAN